MPASTTLREAEDKLSVQSIEFHRAIVSLTEELENRGPRWTQSAPSPVHQTSGGRAETSKSRALVAPVEPLPMDVKKALLDPAANFSDPQAVVDNRELSQEQKVQIPRRRWEYDIRELEAADGEGMTAPKPPRVSVRAALRQLGTPMPPDIPRRPNSADSFDTSTCRQMPKAPNFAAQASWREIFRIMWSPCVYLCLRARVACPK